MPPPHVLEHLPDLCAFLAELYDVLKPGGAVFTEVPNHNRAKVMRKKNKWHYHLTLPTPQGFVNIMTASGFVPVVEEVVFSDEAETVEEGSVIRGVFTKHQVIP